MAIKITGAVRLPNNTLFSNSSIIIKRTGSVAAQANAVMLVDRWTVYTDGAGEVDFDIEPGSYIAYADTNLGRIEWPFNVAETPASQEFETCVEAVAPTITPSLVLQAEDAADRAEAAALTVPLHVATFAELAGLVPGDLAVGESVAVLELNGQLFRRVASGGDLNYTGTGGIRLAIVHGPAQFDTFANAEAVTIAQGYTLIADRIFQRVTAPYTPTHEFQLTDAGGATWVDQRFVRSNNRMPLVVLVSGQSNSLGVSGGNGGDIASQPDVWTYERHPVAPQTTGWKLGFKESPDYPTGQTGNHYAYHFCARLARETNRPVCMVPYSIGGQDIAEWLPGGGGLSGATGTMWDNLLSAWNQAKTVALPFRSDSATLADLGLTRADYVLWHQGEENRNATATYPTGNQGRQFKRDLIRVFGAWLNPASVSSAADPLIRPDTPILMGEIPYGATDGADDRNHELTQVACEVENVFLARIGHIPTSDGIHFDPDHIERIADYKYDLIGSVPPTGWDVTLADDELYEFRPSHVSGMYTIYSAQAASRLAFAFHYRVTAGAGQISVPAALPGGWLIQLLDNVDLTTLGNATDGQLAVSAFNGRIQIRNRRGASLPLRIQPMTRQPLPGFTVAE